jgi:hypothetical protein
MTTMAALRNPLEDPYEKAPDSFSADFFSEHPAPCPSPGRKLWYSVAVPVSFLQLRPRLLYSTRVLRRVLSAAVLRARVSPTRVLLRLLPALLSSSVLSTRLGRLWVAEVLRARAVWLRSLTATLVGPRTSASSVEPFALALWRQGGATKQALCELRLSFLVAAPPR